MHFMSKVFRSVFGAREENSSTVSIFPNPVPLGIAYL